VGGDSLVIFEHIHIIEKFKKHVVLSWKEWIGWTGSKYFIENNNRIEYFELIKIFFEIAF
jgi:hypothetical protein